MTIRQSSLIFVIISMHWLFCLFAAAQQNPAAPDTAWTRPKYDEGAGNLLANPGFERLKINTRNQPADWVEIRHDRDDRIEVVTDPDGAHWGRRYLRLYAPADGPIQVHSIPPGGIELEPGQDYTVSVWARTDGGDSATLSIEPGRGKANLTDQWTEYRFDYQHPQSAGALLGCFVAVQGGPAAFDDVSLVRSSEAWVVPAEWQAVWPTEGSLNTDRRWYESNDGEPWAVRVPIWLIEVMNQSADDHVVAIPLREVFSAYSYEFIGPGRVVVLDGSSEQPVKSAIVNDDRYPHINDDRYAHITSRDYLLFRASCPARTQRRYDVYLKDPRKHVGRHPALNRPPAALAQPNTYPHRLYLDVGEPQVCVELKCAVRDGTMRASVLDRAGRRPTAMLISPDGSEWGALRFVQDHDQPMLWTTTLSADELAVSGVWKVQATLHNGGDTPAASASVTFTVGPAIWSAGSMRRIDRDDPPLFGADGGVSISAARNERESFQIAIDLDEHFGAVDLSVTDLVSRASDRIASSHVEINRVEDVFITSPAEGAAAGWYADVILPWGNVEVGPAERALAWITVTIPADATHGIYHARIVARIASGATLSIPLKLTVFDFELPDRLTFTPVLGADPWGPFYRYPKAVKLTNPTGEDGAYYCFDREAMREYAYHLARNHCTPWYYYQETSPYPSPWQYNPETKTAKFDFTIFDREAETLLRAGAKYLFVGERIMSLWNRAGWIADWQNDELSWTEWKGRPHNHRHRLDSPEGLDMLRAWGRAMAAHLKEKGWLDKAYVYVVDEAKTEEARAATAIVAQILRELPIPLKTWGASYCHSWLPFHAHMSAMCSSGLASDEVLAEFQQRGATYWGTYNRSHFVGYPLSIPRIIGPQSFFFGVKHYMLWSSWRTVSGWVNAHSYRMIFDDTSYPRHTFVRHEMFSYGQGTMNIPWPAGEPLPVGKTRAFATTLRFEALRESVEDYEYLAMLDELAQRDETTARQARDLLVRLEALIQSSGLATYVKDPRVTTHTIYDIDEHDYQQLRHEMGHLIASGQRP